jgi:uncharacterized membrane protein YedE/YeeE
MKRWRSPSAYGAGLLFGIGLVISGMADPRNIIGFLDVAGAWKPNLAAVMVGAIAVHAGLLRLFDRRRSAAVLASPPTVIDARLVLGSAIFGVGWGLSGYCPGPAIVSLGFGVGRVWLFVVAALAGTWLADRLVFDRVLARRLAPEQSPAANAAGR